MNILLVGSNYFQKALQTLGHRVVWAGRHQDADIPISDLDVHVPSLISALPEPPEMILWTDDLGARMLPLGLCQVNIPKIWYGVDGPINLFWHEHFAPLFDLVLADQKACAEKLESIVPGRSHWLPVAVDTSLYQGPPESHTHDICFIGVINERVRPKRSNIIDLLSERYHVRTAGGRDEAWVSPGDAARMYRRARLVLNENLFSGVTTRMFEVMASGGVLLTEADQDGLDELFRPGEDFIPFEPGNLFEVTEKYLQDGPARGRMAAQGRDRVLEEHDILHRAVRVLRLAEEMNRESGFAEGADYLRCLGKTLFWCGVRRPSHNGSNRVLTAESHLSRALEIEATGGKIDPDTYFLLGQIARYKGQTRKVLEFWNKAVDRGCLRAELGLAYFELERHSRALALTRFNAVFKKHDLTFPQNTEPGRPLSSDQHLAIGRLLETTGHGLTPGFSKHGQDIPLWDAVDHYQAALNLDPGHLESLIGLGKLLMAYGAYAEAHIFLQTAARMRPDREYLARSAYWAGQQGFVRDIFPRKVA